MANTVAGLDLAGNPVNIPADRVEEAQKAGYKLAPAAPSTSPTPEGGFPTHTEEKMPAAGAEVEKTQKGFDLGGNPVEIPNSKLFDAYQAGYKLETPVQKAVREQESGVGAFIHGADTGLLGGGMGKFVSWLTGETPQETLARKAVEDETNKQHPEAHVAGVVAGAVAPALLGDVTGLGAAAESKLAAAGSPIIGKAIASSIVGLTGVAPSIIGEAAQGEWTRAGETAAAGIVLPALLFGGGKVASIGAGKAWDAAQPLLSKITPADAAGAALKYTWSNTAGAMLRTIPWAGNKINAAVEGKIGSYAESLFGGAAKEAPEAAGAATTAAPKSFADATAFIKTPEGNERMRQILSSDPSAYETLSKGRIPAGLFPDPIPNTGTDEAIKSLAETQSRWASALSLVPKAIVGGSAQLGSAGVKLYNGDVSDNDALLAAIQAKKFEADPSAAMEAVSRVTSTLNRTPETGMVTQHAFNASSRALSYIAANSPAFPAFQPFQDNSHWEPNPIDMLKLKSVVAVARDPASVVWHLNNGSLNSEHVDTLDALYPSLAKDLRSSVFEVAASPDAPKLDLARRMQLSLLTGVRDPNVDGMSLQADFQVAPQEGDQGPQNSPGKPGGGKPKVSTKPRADKLPSTLTPAQGGMFGAEGT